MTFDAPDLVPSPRQRARKLPAALTVGQIAELLGRSRFAAYRWLRAAEKHSGLPLIQVSPRGKILVSLHAFKTVFSDLWESHLDAQAMAGGENAHG